ncbi:MAG: response regulator transcription factor [Dehalococcoidia bacterium]
MSSEKVLVVEDTPDVLTALNEALEDAGYTVLGVSNGDDALRSFYEFQPNLALLDVLLPGLTGFELCERIRAMSNVPIIMFSALGNEREKVWALERGADDYVVKGTSIGELLARVAANLRRAQNPAPGPMLDRFTDDEIEVDFASRIVHVRGEQIDLTPTEYKLLSMLLRKRGQPVPAEQLLHGVWGREYDTEELVKWHVGHLRRKIERDPSRPRMLVTRRGFGYVYVEQTVQQAKAA